jgi:hypothetical protein
MSATTGLRRVVLLLCACAGTGVAAGALAAEGALAAPGALTVGAATGAGLAATCFGGAPWQAASRATRLILAN